MFAVRLWSERGSIQGLDHVQNVESVLARHSLDIAVVARGTKVQLLEYGDGFRVTLFHVTDDRVAADQLIESKHSGAPLGKVVYAPGEPKVYRLFSMRWERRTRFGWVISPKSAGWMAGHLPGTTSIPARIDWSFARGSFPAQSLRTFRSSVTN